MVVHWSCLLARLSELVETNHLLVSSSKFPGSCVIATTTNGGSSIMCARSSVIRFLSRALQTVRWEHLSPSCPKTGDGCADQKPFRLARSSNHREQQKSAPDLTPSGRSQLHPARSRSCSETNLVSHSKSACGIVAPFNQFMDGRPPFSSALAFLSAGCTTRRSPVSCLSVPQSTISTTGSASSEVLSPSASCYEATNWRNVIQLGRTRAWRPNYTMRSRTEK